MGLHADIHQVDREVTITLCGEFHPPELDQLRCILAHFRNRGCRTVVLDLSRVAPLSAGARDSLRSLTGVNTIPRARQLRRSAIRLAADTPAARPQTGCGEPAFSAAF